MSASPEMFAGLVPSWRRALVSENKSPNTIKSYLTGVDLFLRWCDAQGVPAEFSKRTVQAFIASLLEAGASPGTAMSRQNAVKRFSSWLASEGEIDHDALVGMAWPKLEVKPAVPLSEDQLRLLLKACAGNGFRERRDTALVRLMAETGLRAGEVVGLTVADIDLDRGLATIIKAKGKRGRVVPFGPHTTAALDRWLRVRRSHRLAGTGALWLGEDGKGFGYAGLDNALRARAAAAGISGFHLHLLRNTAATRWLAAGGSEGGLMAVAGWRRRDMLDRYVAATAAERAAAEARTLNLGDL